MCTFNERITACARVYLHVVVPKDDARPLGRQHALAITAALDAELNTTRDVARYFRVAEMNKKVCVRQIFQHML